MQRDSIDEAFSMSLNLSSAYTETVFECPCDREYCNNCFSTLLARRKLAQFTRLLRPASPSSSMFSSSCSVSNKYFLSSSYFFLINRTIWVSLPLCCIDSGSFSSNVSLNWKLEMAPCTSITYLTGSLLFEIMLTLRLTEAWKRVRMSLMGLLSLLVAWEFPSSSALLNLKRRSSGWMLSASSTFS